MSQDERFEELVARYQRLLMSLIHRYWGGRLSHQADDLAQEVWAKLWVQFKKNESNVINFKSYMVRTLQTTMWDAIRTCENAAEEALSEETPTGCVPSGEAALLQSLQLQRLLEGLPDEEALMLRAHAQGFSSDEIARMLGCGEGRVRNRVSRLKKQLARKAKRWST